MIFSDDFVINSFPGSEKKFQIALTRLLYIDIFQ